MSQLNTPAVRPNELGSERRDDAQGAARSARQQAELSAMLGLRVAEGAGCRAAISALAARGF